MEAFVHGKALCDARCWGNEIMYSNPEPSRRHIRFPSGWKKRRRVTMHVDNEGVRRCRRWTAKFAIVSVQRRERTQLLQPPRPNFGRDARSRTLPDANQDVGANQFLCLFLSLRD